MVYLIINSDTKLEGQYGLEIKPMLILHYEKSEDRTSLNIKLIYHMYPGK